MIQIKTIFIKFDVNLKKQLVIIFPIQYNNYLKIKVNNIQTKDNTKLNFINDELL